MTRNKNKDIQLLDTFIHTLQQFKQQKLEKWEKIEDVVQASIIPGSPSEDWITPPDEKEAEKQLLEDPNYTYLRDEITRLKGKIQEIALFLQVDLHHSFEWLKFSTPLIGNAALDDVITFSEQLKKTCKTSNYLTKNIKYSLFRK